MTAPTPTRPVRPRRAPRPSASAGTNSIATTVRAIRHPAVPSAPPRIRECVPSLVVALGALMLSVVLPDGAAGRALLALGLALALAGFNVRFPRQGATLTLMWLATVGGFRRLVSTFQADPGSDPLLLVGPVGVIVLTYVSLRTSPLPRWLRDMLAALVASFSVLTLVGVLNPNNPTLVAAVQGLLFWLMPLLWFWVARAVIGSEGWTPLLRWIAQVCTLASVYGLLQAFLGFPPWDERWLTARGYRALEVNGPDTLRSFSFFPSAAEHALAASIGIVLCALFAARAVKRRSWVLAGLWIVEAGIGLTAVTFSSVRTAFVLTALALSVVFMASRGWRLGRILLVGLASLVLLVAVAGRVDVTKMSDRGLSGMVRRTVNGVAHPFDNQASTLGAHLNLTRRAFGQAVEYPFGKGTATATIAADKAGGTNDGGENDLANALLAFGFPGAILVIQTIIVGLVSAFWVGRRDRTLGALGALGLLVLELRFWWAGAHYFAAPLVWAALGWVSTQAHPRAHVTITTDPAIDPASSGEPAALADRADRTEVPDADRADGPDADRTDAPDADRTEGPDTAAVVG